MNTCPICGYPDLEDAPANYEICPSCGTEFGYTDIARTHADLQQQWVDAGAHWYSRVTPQPVGWNAYKQLLDAGFIKYEPSAPDAESKISTVDLGTDTIRVTISGSLGAQMKTRLVALGRAVPSMFTTIRQTPVPM